MLIKISPVDICSTHTISLEKERNGIESIIVMFVEIFCVAIKSERLCFNYIQHVFGTIVQV